MCWPLRSHVHPRAVGQRSAQDCRRGTHPHARTAFTHTHTHPHAQDKVLPWIDTHTHTHTCTHIHTCILTHTHTGEGRQSAPLRVCTHTQNNVIIAEGSRACN